MHWLLYYSMALFLYYMSPSLVRGMIGRAKGEVVDDYLESSAPGTLFSLKNGQVRNATSLLRIVQEKEISGLSCVSALTK